MQHRRGAGFRQCSAQPFQHGLDDLRKVGTRKVRKAEPEHAWRQPEQPPVEGGVVERHERQQAAPCRWARDSSESRHVCDTKGGLTVEAFDDGQAPL